MVDLSDQNLLSKFRGCLVGSHVGDCFGRPYEFLPVEKSKLSKLIINSSSDESSGINTDLLPYTDDTAMTLSVGRSLVAKNCFNAGDMGKRFAEEYIKEPNRGYSNNVGQMLREIAKQSDENIFQPAKFQFGGTGSYGNGSAMRIAPVALFAYNCRSKALQIAKESSLLTHAHRHGYNGGILQCLAISKALQMDPSLPMDAVAFINELLEEMKTIEGTESNSGSDVDEGPFCTKLMKIKEFLDVGVYVPIDTVVWELGNSITAQQSVPTAIYAFLRGLKPVADFESNNHFLRTLYFAISLHGDTDTIAAMACAITGAYHGIAMIPNGIQNKCESIDSSRDLAQQLYKLHFS